MASGLIGVPLGSFLAQKYRVRWHQADPLICAIGLIISVPLLFFAIVTVTANSVLCYTLVFFGQLSLNLNWSIVADILLVRDLTFLSSWIFKFLSTSLKFFDINIAVCSNTN